MIEVVKFQAEHLIDLYEIDTLTARRAVAIERNVKDYGGIAYSALLDGRCIGCGGILFDGWRYVAWVDTTPDLLRYKLEFHKHALRLYKEFKARAGAIPIQALCDEQVTKNVKWAMRIGFKPTAVRVMEAA